MEKETLDLFKLESSLRNGSLSYKEEFLLARNPKSQIRSMVARFSTKQDILELIFNTEPTVNVMFQLTQNNSSTKYKQIKDENFDHPCVSSCDIRSSNNCMGCSRPNEFYQTFKRAC